MPSTYPEIYFPVLVQFVIAMALAGGLIAASTLLGKRARSPLKDTPYESGMAPVGSARERFSVKFYLVGMIFILFDIEAVFLYPWAVVYRELKLFGFFEMFIFVAVVLIGFFYVYKKGALDWWDSWEGGRKGARSSSIPRFSKPRKPWAKRHCGRTRRRSFLSAAI